MADLGLWVGNSAVLTPNDTAIRDLLVGMGHTVTYRDDSVTPTVGLGHAACVLAESCTGSTNNAAFATLTLPWLSMDIGGWIGTLLASVANTNGATSSRFFDLVAHDITAGITPTDNCQVKNTNAGMWGTPGSPGNLAPDAFVFAWHGSSATHAMGICVEQGDELEDGSAAPARRVGLAYIDSTTNPWVPDLTPAGIQLFEQAIDWMLLGPVAPSEGSASGSVSWSGAATGVASHAGTASGSTLWAGTASGAREAQGTASGSVVWSGTAVGEAPAIGAAEGSASGAVIWAGAAVGAAAHQGLAAGATAWAGLATGQSATQGVAAGSVVWAGTASGAAAHAGIATGVVVWSGTASGDSGSNTAIVVGELTGPDRFAYQMTGPTTRRTLSGTIIRRLVTGTSSTPTGTTGPALAPAAATGPELARTASGSAASRIVTGSET